MTISVPESTPSPRRRTAGKDFSWLTVAACLWVGLFPLLHFGTYTTLTRDKWIIMFVFAFFTLLCVLMDGVHHRLSRPAKLPLLLGGLLVCWTILSCTMSRYDADIWWIGGSARKEGLITQLCYLLLFFCFACSRTDSKPVLCSAALGVGVYFLIIMYQRTGRNPFGLYPERTSYALNPEFQGTTGNTDMGTGYLCLLIGLFVFSLFQPFLSRRKNPARKLSLWDGITLLLSLIGLVLSVYLLTTMDIQFGLIALVAIFLFELLQFLPRKARLPLLILLLILALLIVWFWPGSSGGLWEFHEILHGRVQPSFGHNRVAVWRYSLSLARERLLFGGGSDTFEQRFNAWLQDNGAIIPTQQGTVLLPNYFDNPHNEYLAQLLNHGLPVLLLFLALILTAVFHPRSRHSPYHLAIVGYAVQAFFSFSVCIVAPIFWVLLGLCASCTRSSTVHDDRLRDKQDQSNASSRNQQDQSDTGLRNEHDQSDANPENKHNQPDAGLQDKRDQPVNLHDQSAQSQSPEHVLPAGEVNPLMNQTESTSPGEPAPRRRRRSSPQFSE